MNRIEQTTLDAIRSRVDIVALISRDVTLRRRGASFMGRCPFHDERTPSFSVVPGKGFLCFGCGARGDAIRYIARTRGLAFLDAVRELGKLAGIAVGEGDGGRSRDRSPRPPLAALPRQRTRSNEPEEPSRTAQLELWDRCLTIAVPPGATEGQQLAWCALWESGIDPSLVARLDLARVLPDVGALPAGVPSWWRRGWWLVIPTRDHLGAFAGLRARFVGRRWKGHKRSPPFAGKEVSCLNAPSAGRVYACAVAAEVLAGRRAIEAGGGRLEWDGSLLIAEGGRGFLSARCAAWAGPVETSQSQGYSTRGVMGLWSGAWSQAIGDRIPTGTRVLIAADHDGSGDRYADAVTPTLENRCSVARWTAHVEDGR